MESSELIRVQSEMSEAVSELWARLQEAVAPAPVAGEGPTEVAADAS